LSLALSLSTSLSPNPALVPSFAQPRKRQCVGEKFALTKRTQDDNPDNPQKQTKHAHYVCDCGRKSHLL
jgi:hypothetical protein